VIFSADNATAEAACDIRWLKDVSGPAEPHAPLKIGCPDIGYL
jgi:hypothetical protein